MKGKRKELNERMIAFREDYMRANARINFLLATDDRGDELERLEAFVGYIDNLVECFPESQRNVLRLCILDDVPLTNAAIDIGYHYTWVIQLRDQAVATLEEILDGNSIVRSKRGLEVLEKLDAYYGKNNGGGTNGDIASDIDSINESTEHSQED